MRQTVSANRTNAEIARASLASALRNVPKLTAVEREDCVSGNGELKLTSKQTNLVVAHLNRELKARGLAPITAKELIRQNLKATFSGCLDPCEGIGTDKLLGMLESRFRAAVGGA